MKPKRFLQSFLTLGFFLGTSFSSIAQKDIAVVSTQKINENSGGLGSVLTANSHFGRDLYTAGDLDNDGVTDLISCAATYSGNNSKDGAIFILFMNKDNTVKSKKVFDSSTLPFSLSTNDYFGYSATPMGDLDGNGVTDIAVSAPGTSTFTGAIYILYLDNQFNVSSYKKIDKSSHTALSGLKTNNYFATNVRNYGDLNGDGNTDLLVGADFDDDGGTDRGAVYILFLDSDQDVQSVKKINSSTTNFSGNLDDFDHFGIEIDIIKDIDKDGLNEIAVSANFDDDGGTNRGAFYIISLDNNGDVQWASKVSSSSTGFTSVLKDNSYLGAGLAYVPTLTRRHISANSADSKYFYMAVGSHYDNDGGSQRGAVYLMLIDSAGNVKGYRKISDSSADFNASLADEDRLGQGIASYETGTDTTVLFIGAQYDDDSKTDAGAVYALNLLDTSLKNSSGIFESTATLLQVTLYPNPAQDNLSMEIADANGPVNIQIYDISGRLLIAETKVLNNKINVNVNKLESGTYLLKLQSRDKAYTGRFIKQ